MKIGVPKEIKNSEYRVSIIPAGADSLIRAGNEVLVQAGAGVGSGFSDEEYIQAGAKILPTADEVFAEADMIVKIKEYMESEYHYLREDQIVFTYLHLAASRPLTDALLASHTPSVAYETIVGRHGGLPLLAPMSEIAGRMSVQFGAAMLQKVYGGSGTLLAGVPGVLPGDVVVIGGGSVGLNAARMASGLGARVTVFDIDTARLAYIDDISEGRIQTCYSNDYNITRAVKSADLLIGAVLIPGSKAPKVVSEEMVKQMKKGSAIVDVAIDQGGCIETMDRVTTHEAPFFEKYGVVHCAVANIPGAVPRTATMALSNVTLPYIKRLAEGGLETLRQDVFFRKGLNTYKGKITCEGVANALGMKYVSAEDLL